MHKKQIFYIFSFFLFGIMNNAFAQISGELQSNVNFYMCDSNIGAYNNELYDNFQSGNESWLALRYSGPKDFNANVRIDGFQNSNLLNPTSGYSKVGLGMFNVSKTWDDLTITAGHVYDQIGSGIIYRAYEDRPLLIDNALFGLQAKYKFNDHLSAKAFMGQVRNLFSSYNGAIKGANFEGDYDWKSAHFTPGIGVVNRTMDKASMQPVVATINALPQVERFTPTHNVYAATLYNTLNVGDFTWYAEAARKTVDVILDQNGKLTNTNGSVLYSTLGWAPGKFGVTVSGKRTQNFTLRTSPNEILLRGFTNWQPVIANIRPQRTIARYTPASNDLSELSGSVNMYYTPNDNVTINGNYTHINNLAGAKLFREAYADVEIRSIKNLTIHPGFQFMQYNQPVYQSKGTKILTSYTPFIEATYKISEKRSIKTDLQYMDMNGDYGSWIYALIEYDIAPKWAFAISDMYNTNKGADLGIHPGLTSNHYPNVFVAYTRNAHRFTAQYVKQVEGINCTGGVCRYEPAFSGFKIGLSSSF
jgi:hypothetical protein